MSVKDYGCVSNLDGVMTVLDSIKKRLFSFYIYERYGGNRNDKNGKDRRTTMHRNENFLTNNKTEISKIF